MAVFGFGHASCEDLKIKRGRGVLDNEDFQKANSSSGIKMHLKGGKRQSPWFSPQAGYQGCGANGATWMGEGRSEGGEGEGSPRLAAAVPFPPVPGRTGRRGGLRTPLTYLQDNKDDI